MSTSKNADELVTTPTRARSVATINDVAARAGVSIKTVSRVVNREPNVRAEMAQRVQQAIDELNYRPNFSARNLAGRKAYLIAMVYDNPSDSYVIGIQHGALDACRQLGYSLLLQPCVHDGATVIDELLTLVRERRPTGLLLVPPVCDMPAIRAALNANHIDYACVGSGQAGNANDQGLHHQRVAPVVHADDYQGAHDLVTYLLKLGHDRIAMIQGHPDHVTAHRRTEGYLHAHRDLHKTVDPQWLLPGLFTFESGVAAAHDLLSRANRPTAIFAANDEMAAGVLHVAHEKGISVPGQLSVAGFDDLPLARCVWPSLTTVRQPIRAMAQSAVTHLVKVQAARARGLPVTPSIEVLRTELVIRASTAPPARTTHTA